MSSPDKDEQTDEETTDPSGDPTASDQPIEETRIIIRDDGEVVIENLSERLVEVAMELDPDSELACRLEPTTEDD